MTSQKTIKAWSREQLELAFSQREFQLQRLQSKYDALRRAWKKQIKINVD